MRGKGHGELLVNTHEPHLSRYFWNPENLANPDKASHVVKFMRRNRPSSYCGPGTIQSKPNLAGRESLGDSTLESQLLLLQVISRGVLDLELGHSLAESRLDLLLLSALDLEGHRWVRDDLLNPRDVRLKLLLGLELLGESLVGGLELLGLADHVVDLSGRELTNRVGDGDVGAAAGGLLSGGDLKDTVDVDLEDTLEDGLTSLHRWDWCKGELSEGGVVLAQFTRSPWKTGN